MTGAGKPPRNGLGSFGGELAVIRRGSFLEGSDAGEAESRLLGLDRTLCISKLKFDPLNI